MKRRALLVGSLLLPLAACSSGGGKKSAKNPSSLTEIGFFTDKAAWEPSFDAMNKLSGKKNMKLKFTGYSDPTAYDSFIKQSFRTKKVPDLFTWHTGSQLQDLVDQNLVAETTDLWSQATDDGLVPDGLIDNYTFDEKQYGVPLNIAYWVMYYNKKVYAEHDLEVPTTWDELMSNATTLKKAGVVPFLQMNIIFEFVWFMGMLIGYDPDAYDGLMTGKTKYTDKSVVAVAKEWGRMIDEGYFNDPGNKTDPQTLLNSGKVAMGYYGTFFTGQLTALKAKPGEDYGTFVLPNMNPDVKDPQMVLETGPMLVGKGSENEETALAYSKWWMTTNAQQKWSDTRGDVSFNPNVKLDDPTLDHIVADVNDPKKKFRSHVRYLEGTPLPVYTTETEVFGAFVTNGGDPMPALKKLQESADKYWAEHQ